MHFQIRDAKCPRCSRPVYIATVVRHPTRADLAHHNYECADCGPVTTKILSLRAEDGETARG